MKIIINKIIWNKYNIIFSITSIILFVLGSAPVAIAQEQSDWQELENEHFIIRYYELDNNTLSMITREAENAYDKVTSDLQYFPNNKTIIQVFPDESNPNWKWSGYYSPGLNLIELRPPPETKYTSVNYEYYFKVSVTHEYTHHIISEGYQMRFPEWLGEGVATYESGDELKNFPAYNKFKKIAAKNELISLKKMWLFDLLEDNEIDLAYIESYTVIEYIINTYGYDGLIEILTARKENPHMDEVIEDALGISFEEFELGWMSFVKEKYGQPLYELYLYDLFYLIVAALLLRRGVRIWTKRKNN